MNFDFLKFLNKKEGVCTAPFSQVYIYPDGRVFLCPDCYMHPNAQIGNLNDNTFDEIWNGKKAQNIRNQILKNLHVFCSYSSCREKSNFHLYTILDRKIDYSCIQKKYPKMVSLAIDSECNASCIMCRGDIFRCTDEEIEVLKDKIENLYLPILKDAEYLTLSTTADPFASRATRLLMKRAAQTYPSLKFDLLTNGTLCDEFNCKDTGIIDRLSSVMFSVHSCTQETYDSIVKNGNFQNVCENIKWMSSFKKSGKIDNFFLAFVVSSKNYKEIPQFVEFANDNNAVALFWSCRDWGGNLSYTDEDLQVCDPKHDKYLELKEILKSIELETEYSHFSHQLHNIKNS